MVLEAILKVTSDAWELALDVFFFFKPDTNI